VRSFEFPWRVVADYGARYDLSDPADQTRETRYAGLAQDRPAVGDYARLDANGDIDASAPRRSWIARAGTNGRPQTIAANVDYGFVVTSPEPREFSPRRIVRYLIALRAGNVDPVKAASASD